ncbi:MAG: SHOCT domain-containing protein [Methanobacteriota archaeon]|nr:MAG: SHOCT domain-containing protein [Euryarchaeota archaeon]
MSTRSWLFPRHAFRWAFLAFLGLIALGVAASLVAWAIRGPGTGFGFGFPFFGFGFGWFFFLLFFLFFWGFRWWGWGWYGRPYWRYRDDAHEILRARYARGEITKDQFDQMMRDLESHA